MNAQTGPRVLLVTAHPDDEAFFAVTLFRLVRECRAELDVLVVTAGEGGFRHSALAERLYGVALTDPAVARRELPRLRARELRAALALLGAREHTIVGEPDTGFTLDAAPFVEGPAWNPERVRLAVLERLERGYDLVLVMLPEPTTHGHHKASAVLTLEALRSTPAARRPCVLGGAALRSSDNDLFLGLEAYAITRTRHDGRPVAVIDRTRSVRAGSPVPWGVVADWVIAEHKSQGVMQTRMGLYAREAYWSFAIDDDAAEAKARSWLALLA